MLLLFTIDRGTITDCKAFFSLFSPFADPSPLHQVHPSSNPPPKATFGSVGSLAPHLALRVFKFLGVGEILNMDSVRVFFRVLRKEKRDADRFDEDIEVGNASYNILLYGNFIMKGSLRMILNLVTAEAEGW